MNFNQEEHAAAVKAAEEALLALLPCTQCKYYRITDPVGEKPEGPGECTYDLTCSDSVENRPYGGCDDLHREWALDVDQED